MNSEKNKLLGAQGEAIAAKFLMKKGLRFIDRNFHAQGGEIDLIFQDPENGEYIFVEVKTRTSNAFGDAKSAITRSKFEKILRAGEDFFLKKLQLDDVPDFRVDALILRIEGSNIFCEHIPHLSFDDF